MKATIIVFPCSNCDRDTRDALIHVGCRDVSYTSWRDSLPDADLYVLPGGFSWGDYLRPGAISARSLAVRDLYDHARRGAHILGICNGFQILTEAGLLPGTLIRNHALRFICRTVDLRIDNTDSPFTHAYQSGQNLRFTIAHQDGAFFADDPTLDSLEENQRIALRYAKGDNPNGSQRDIAGILNAKGNVLGLMPHPERHIDDDHPGGYDGRVFFRHLLDAIA